MKVKNPFLRGMVGALIAIIVVFALAALIQGGAVVLGAVGEMINVRPLNVWVYGGIILAILIWVGIQVGNDFFNNHDKNEGKNV